MEVFYGQPESPDNKAIRELRDNAVMDNKFTKRANLWMIGLTIAVVILTVVLVWQGLTSRSSSLIWKGFYYKNAEYPSNPIQESLMVDEAPTFFSLQDCMKWGNAAITDNPADGFECSYGCRFDKQFNAVICRDTTKMIYFGRFQR